MICIFSHQVLNSNVVTWLLAVNCQTYYTRQTAIYELASHLCRCNCEETKSAEYLRDLMISMGVAIDSSSSENENALMVAIVKGNQDTALMLIRAGADTNYLHVKDRFTKNRSYVHLASAYGCNEVIELLLEKGANVDIKDSVSRE